MLTGRQGLYGHRKTLTQLRPYRIHKHIEPDTFTQHVPNAPHYATPVLVNGSTGRRVPAMSHVDDVAFRRRHHTCLVPEAEGSPGTSRYGAPASSIFDFEAVFTPYEVMWSPGLTPTRGRGPPSAPSL